MSGFTQKFEYLGSRFDGVPNDVKTVKKKLLHYSGSARRRIKRAAAHPLPFRHSAVKKNEAKSDHCFSIDQKSLSELVKEKSPQKLEIYGGVVGVARALYTNVESGIQGDPDDVARRKEAFGSNTCSKSLPKGFFHFMVESFKDLTIVILMACGALSLGIGMKEHGLAGGWYDGGSIFAAVFTVILVSSMSNYRQYRLFVELSQERHNVLIEVLRSNRCQQISVFEIVVGDVIFLRIGDQVPADGLFLDGDSLQVGDSSMTGESDHVDVNKNHCPFLFSGTEVVEGWVKMLVTSVGMNTKLSQIETDEQLEQTPLEEYLNNSNLSIVIVGLAVACAVLVVLLIGFLVGKIEDKNGVAGMVNIAITIFVAAIPEGLPLAVSLTIFYSMKKMMKETVLVQKRSVCETMASTTVVCTNKTGMLTSNDIEVAEFWLGPHFVERTSSVHSRVAQLIQEGIFLNTTGMVYKPTSDSEYEFTGSPTERAILKWAVANLGMAMEQLLQSCTILQVVAFNSNRKCSGVLIRREVDNTVHVHWKGAAEIMLAKCSTYYDISGRIMDLDEGNLEKFKKIIEGMEARGHRCIALTHAQVLDLENETDEIVVCEVERIKEDGLTLLGIVGIKNSYYQGTKEAVQECLDAKINVVLITGENVYNAKFVATNCGILKDDEHSSEAIVEVEEFRKYIREQNMDRVEKIRVLARSSPSDKLKIVQCLQQRGHVVAITGDSTDDAPALAKADVGISIGRNATQTVRSCSDIVILDDGFSNLVTALRWAGWNHYNIIKLTLVQLTVNVVALALNSMMAITKGEVLISTLGLCASNLIIYIGFALTLAIEKPQEKLTERAPKKKTATTIENFDIWMKVLSRAFYLIVVLWILWLGQKYGLFSVNVKDDETLIFNAVVLYQVYCEFHAEQKPAPIWQLLTVDSSTARG